MSPVALSLQSLVSNREHGLSTEKRDGGSLVWSSRQDRTVTGAEWSGVASDINTMIHRERRAATCPWPSVRSRKCCVEGAPQAERVSSGEPHSDTVTVWRPRTFGSIFLQASCFLHGCTHEEQCLCWQFILCSSYPQPCRTHCVALTALGSVQGSRCSVYSEGP